MMDRLNEKTKKYDMRINVKKTRVMRIKKEGSGKIDIVLDGQRVEQVTKFKYLGTWVTDDGRCDLEIRSRIGMAKEKFSSIRELLTASLSKKIKKQIIKTVVWSVALYGSETWAMRKEDRKRVEALELWIWRRMEKISYTEHKTNEEVLARVEERRLILETILNRKKKWIGHVLRHDNLMKLVIEGRMEGKRGRGRKRFGMLDDIKNGEEYVVMKRRAENREKWRNWMP